MPLPLYEEKEATIARKKKPSTQKPNRFRARGNKIHFISLGCPRNLVDTEVMLGILLKAGYEPTPELSEADDIVINTCGFLEASREESLDTIAMSLEGKKEDAKVIVTGCMVQGHSDQILDEFPEIDYLLGSGDVEGILKAVNADEKGELITDARSYLEAGEVPRHLATPGHYAYLKIAEGCRKRCSYCIIPDIKGPLKSKPVPQVIKEFRALLQQGVKEIILIAQDLGDWGRDAGYRKSEGLTYLLSELAKEEGDYWLRLLYLYPDEITPELITCIKTDPRICPYLDMPIQHSHDEVLKAMRRTTSRKNIVETISLLRQEIPEITIRTSLIVGFPGETDEHFRDLCAFVEEMRLDNVGIFEFSNEPGSHAATLPNHVSDAVMRERYNMLMEVQERVVAEINRQWLGKQVEAIVEGYHPDSSLLMRARHRGQCPEIDGQIIVNDGRAVTAFGERYRIEITDVAGYDLIGRVVSS